MMECAEGFTSAFFILRIGNFKSMLYKDQYHSPIGTMLLIADNSALLLAEFNDREDLQIEISNLVKGLKEEMVEEENSVTKRAKSELAGYFAGSLRKFTVPVKLTGSDFQQRVWVMLQELEFGSTSHYEAQAIASGNKKSIRAVANANGQNKIAIIIPCHRVIGKNGSMTGYAGGINRKKWLLMHERIHSKKAGELF